MSREEGFISANFMENMNIFLRPLNTTTETE